MDRLETLVYRTVFEVDRARRQLEGRPMEHTDAVRWALIDLLKLLDAIYGGQYHAEFARIAGTLGVEIPLPPQVEDEAEV